MRTARRTTNRLLDMIAENLVDKDYVINAYLRYMSEDEVDDMCHANEIELWEDVPTGMFHEAEVDEDE